ncbi:uncharacterized protein [Rutidosis leptorrhynchoides]|uniref:uncharacterized protein n=1 Tax=Rutidosis leptorrhynchoides TaxID=125765 RepID=UPI003A99B75D
MDHSWRPPPFQPPITPPPPPGNNICPICSFSHFPFCPPPPPFIQNPNFHYSQPPPPPQNHNYYSNHQPPPPPPPPPTYSQYSLPCNNSDFSYNPNYDTNRPVYPTNPNPSYAYDDNSGVKRLKVDNFDKNNNNNIRDTSRLPSDNDRILKLIHDHGSTAKVGTVGTGHERFGEVRDEIGLKRRREMSDHGALYGNNNNNNVIYDHKDESFLPGSLGYSRHSSEPDRRFTMPPLPVDSMQHHLQSNHKLLPSRDVNQHVEALHHASHAPYSWSESKGHYTPNSFGPQVYHGQPPLPTSPPPHPPPPLPIDQPHNHFFEPPAKKASMVSARSAILENHSSGQSYYTNNAGHHASTVSSTEEFQARQTSSDKHVRDVQLFPLRPLPSDKPNIIDASHIFKHPHRASRPDHLVIILRGLPGSGKSYLAKFLRDIEVENGGEAPRIHSMDEYFITEVEKAEDSELSKSSGTRGKRQVMKKVMEYCYEPEMEEAYRASMLKAFKKTLDEGVYSFIIVDDRNLRVADFAQFWATAKRSGYEVYIVDAAYKDPAGCAARNVHNFTLDDIQKMAGQWEEAPSMYLRMDIKSLLHRDDFDESGIQEVDMDMEDDDELDASQGPHVESPKENIKDQVDELTPNDAGLVKDTELPVNNHPTEEVNHLSKSKWSNDLDGTEALESEGNKKNSALSGLVKVYSKEGKSVRWGDQGGNVGFSISATRKTNTRSLVIGPGSGYNLKSNPLSEEEYIKPARKFVEPKSQNVFQERIRAERESFKAVFDNKRKQRIGGLNMDDE